MTRAKAGLYILPALSTATVLPANMVEMPMPATEDALLRQNAHLEETIRALLMALDQAATLVGDLTKQRPALDRRHILGELVSIKNEIAAARKLVADGKSG